mmetsp:Transcript_37669/g.96351  ORF Transcript_37669/g.96351 Transcript_37669/m.96351 type:complete len:208 (+) Transcript_37669:813-1436(+)
MACVNPVLPASRMSGSRRVLWARFPMSKTSRRATPSSCRTTIGRRRPRRRKSTVSRRSTTFLRSTAFPSWILKSQGSAWRCSSGHCRGSSTIRAPRRLYHIAASECQGGTAWRPCRETADVADGASPSRDHQHMHFDVYVIMLQQQPRQRSWQRRHFCLDTGCSSISWWQLSPLASKQTDYLQNRASALNHKEASHTIVVYLIELIY